jgi:hypothetical protein
VFAALEPLEPLDGVVAAGGSEELVVVAGVGATLAGAGVVLAAEGVGAAEGAGATEGVGTAEGVGATEGAGAVEGVDEGSSPHSVSSFPPEGTGTGSPLLQVVLEGS